MKKLLVVCVVVLLAGCGDGQSETVSTKSASVIPASMNGKLAKQLFGAVPEGSQQSPAPYGSYAKGCLAGVWNSPRQGQRGRRCACRGTAIGAILS